MYQKISRKKLLFYGINPFQLYILKPILCLVLAVLSGSAFSAEEEVEKIKVTGSRISRIDMEGPSPLVVYTSEDLENSGYSSAGDFLRDTTVSHFGVSREMAGSSGSGSSSAAIKGEKSLVLINGLRLVESPWDSSVDLNLIPIYAIERVEVLKDGGSAIYGSDAVGGVINFITKKDFTGLELNAQVTPTVYPWYPGGSRADTALIFGQRKNNWSYTGSFHLRFQDSIENYERRWTNKTASSILPCPLLNFQSDSHLCLQALQEYSTERNREILYKDPGDKINLADYSTRYPHYKQANLFLQGNYKWGETTLYAQMLASYKNDQWTYAPIPGEIENYPGQTIGIKSGKKFHTRFLESGPRLTTYDNFIGDLTLGAKGYLSATWDYDFNVKFARDVQIETAKGLLLKDKITEAIKNRQYQPYYIDKEHIFTLLDQLQVDAPEGKSYTPQAFEKRDLMSALHTGNSRAEYTLLSSYLDFSGESELLDADLATGLQFHARSYKNIVDEQTKANNLLSPAASDGQGRRFILSSYLEGVKYFADILEVQLAGRVDYYSDFGPSFNPKLGLSYKATPNILLRGSINKGFIAPTLDDLNRSKSEGFPWVFDTLACYNELQNFKITETAEKSQVASIYEKLPEMNDRQKAHLMKTFVSDQTKVLNRQDLSAEVKGMLTELSANFPKTSSCGSRQIQSKFGGNKNLKETNSWTASAGSHFQFDENHSLTVDVWYARKDGVPVSGADPEIIKQATAAELFFGPDYVANYANYNVREDEKGILIAEKIEGTTESENTGIAFTRSAEGELQRVDSSLLNLSSTEKLGFDIAWESQMNHIDIYGGSPYFKDDFSYISLEKEEDFPGMGFTDKRRKWGHPVWRNIASLGWKNTKHNLTLVAYTTGSFAKESKELEQLPVYTRFDLDYQWTLSEQTTLRFGWSNLLFFLDVFANKDGFFFKKTDDSKETETQQTAQATSSTEGTVQATANDEETESQGPPFFQFGAPPVDEESRGITRLYHHIFEARGPFFFVGIKHTF